jgi:chromosome segregation ATPase
MSAPPKIPVATRNEIAETVARRRALQREIARRLDERRAVSGQLERLRNERSAISREIVSLIEKRQAIPKSAELARLKGVSYAVVKRVVHGEPYVTQHPEDRAREQDGHRQRRRDVGRDVQRDTRVG